MKPRRLPSTEFRKQLTALIHDTREHTTTSIVTIHGEPVAALIPIAVFDAVQAWADGYSQYLDAERVQIAPAYACRLLEVLDR